MKRKLRAIIITLAVLLIGTGVLLWKMHEISEGLAKQQQADLKEERDLLEDQVGKAIDIVREIDIIPLYLSGDQKNVTTTEFNSVNEVYSEKKSAQVQEMLASIKKNRAFTADKAFWAYNPYGTNRNAMYLYFKTDGNCYCRYTISVDDPDIPDFTRTALPATGGKMSKEHEYQIIGLVAGKKNYITLNLYTSGDKLSETRTYSVSVPESGVQAGGKLKTITGRSKTTISNGLYVVFQDGKQVGGNRKKLKKKKAAKQYAILLYDNSGILRGEIPTDGYVGRNLEQVYGTLLYASGRTKISQVNALGQVTNTVSLGGYRQTGEFAYDGYGNVFVIASRNAKKATPKSKVIAVSLDDGAVKEHVDMDTLFKNVYKKAVKKAGKKNVDWVGLNSVQVTGANQLLLSSKKLSSIIKVSNTSSLLPKIDYILADKRIYRNYKGLLKKVLSKSSGEVEEEGPEETPAVRNILKKTKTPEAFASQYGQEDISYKEGSAEGQGRIALLNCNAGNYAKKNGKSYYYRYLIDEATGTYQLQKDHALDQTKKDGNFVAEKDFYIYCCSDGKYFVESDWDSKAIKQFSTGQRPYRVYKEDFKNFWFY